MSVSVSMPSNLDLLIINDDRYLITSADGQVGFRAINLITRENKWFRFKEDYYDKFEYPSYYGIKTIKLIRYNKYKINIEILE